MRQFVNIPAVWEQWSVSVFPPPLPSQGLNKDTELCRNFNALSLKASVQDVLALLHLQSKLTSSFPSCQLV